jgi:Glycosyl transferases group 1
VCPDLDSYRTYVKTSKAEWSVAKHGYVAGRAGWFSCRSACYLAAGRPVVVEDTGFDAVLPTGRGILAFHEVDEAADAIRAVEADYATHARAARDIAAEYFDARKVLQRLLDRALAN